MSREYRNGEDESLIGPLPTVLMAGKTLAAENRTRRQESARKLFKESKSYGSTLVDETDDPEMRDKNGIAGDRDLLISGDDEPTELIKIQGMLFDKSIHLMLVFVPIGLIVAWAGFSDTVVFITNFLAIMPLASILGDFTEEVAAHTNDTLGGLIQATLGNAVEVVVALQALYANQIRVVQASLLGSVFSNMLLVLGCCFLFGGWGRIEQRFNATSAIANMSLLLLSSLALVIPTPLSRATDEESILLVSRFSGIFLLVMYAQLLYFQFVSHAQLFANTTEDSTNLKLSTAVAGLAIVTGLVALLSEYLVNSIDGFTEQARLSKTFVGLILLPIIGNAVEHITAITVAIKNKMELAMGVAVGSATQVSMFVVPVTVLSGWAMDRPMSLRFPNEEIILYVLSIVIVATSVSNGSSNWLQGSLLVTTYVLVAVACWYENVDEGYYAGSAEAPAN